MQDAANPIALACEDVGSQAVMARLLGVSPALVNQWVKGHRPVPPEHGAAVERVTAGRWRCEVLLPGRRWVRIPDPSWPHPEGRPVLDVATESTPTATEPQGA